MEVIGELADFLLDDLTRFELAAAQHPHGGQIAGRLVVANPHPGGLRATMEPALKHWMPESAFQEWRADQVGRPVATAGKTFVSDDGVVTAVVCPLTDQYAFLAIASHEMLEMADREQDLAACGPEPSDAAESNGVVLLDEYVVERTRREIADGLGWTPSQFDLNPGLVSQTNDVERLLARQPSDGWPTQAFWLHWLNVARVWSMVAGRADAGSRGEREELARWETHTLIDAGGWNGVREALGLGFQRARPHRADRLRFAATSVFGVVERLGRDAWAGSAPKRVFSDTSLNS